MQQVALIVEDDAGLQTLYDRILTTAGFEVVITTDGEQALEALEHLTPDLIFLDILLPKLNGRAVLEYIVTVPELAKTHIAVVSSNQSFFDYTPDLPHIEYIIKPILPEQIRSIATRVRRTPA